jgi:hypothetical protein
MGTRLGRVLAVFALAAGCARTTGPPAAPVPTVGEVAAVDDTVYDVVIRNGRVLDGAGNPWILADVSVRDGRFATIGRVTGRGRIEIDARGKYVSPGWIDMMDQSGSVLPRNGLAENKLRMGVTTAIGGEGGTPVPASGIPEYFAGLERQGISVNFGSYFSETGSRTHAGRARADARDHGYGDARRRHGDDDGAHLPSVELQHDRRAGGGGAGGGAIRWCLREPYPR